MVTVMKKSKRRLKDDAASGQLEDRVCINIREYVTSGPDDIVETMKGGPNINGGSCLAIQPYLQCLLLADIQQALEAIFVRLSCLTCERP